MFIFHVRPRALNMFKTSSWNLYTNINHHKLCAAITETGYSLKASSLYMFCSACCIRHVCTIFTVFFKMSKSFLVNSISLRIIFVSLKFPLNYLCMYCDWLYTLQMFVSPEKHIKNN